jgi:hypothetical protein
MPRPEYVVVIENRVTKRGVWRVGRCLMVWLSVAVVALHAQLFRLYIQFLGLLLQTFVCPTQRLIHPPALRAAILQCPSPPPAATQ